ncbi:MAG: 1,6-anhydro-N-acetylmuramyl-L-alanine amidase AmpD [Gammaproteobacteria bacterium]
MLHKPMIELNLHTGWLSPSRQVPSPNFNERPLEMEISLLVIHGISLPEGKFGTSYIDALFTNTLDVSLEPSFSILKDLQVSAHLLINRAGEVTQYVPLHKRAWHAGESQFAGRSNCNDFSIGIELEGTDTTLYTALQYKKLVEITRILMHYYPRITRERIVGHCDIAPGRKTDPGPAFDWDFFRQELDT